LGFGVRGDFAFGIALLLEDSSNGDLEPHIDATTQSGWYIFLVASMPYDKPERLWISQLTA
jgi:hypothetical protein